MIGLLVIFLLSSITQQTNGLPHIDTNASIEPESREETSIYENENDRYEGQDEDRADNFADEELRNANYEQDDEEQNSRRLFDWFSRLFHTTTPKNVVTRTITDSEYQKDLKARVFLNALHRNLTDALGKLSHIEKNVAMAMEELESYAILTKGKPRILNMDQHYYLNRQKRDVDTERDANNIESTSITSIEHNGNLTKDACNHNETSGRRSGGKLSASEIKDKLVAYLNGNFKEIATKVELLQKLKKFFEKNATFYVGYILSNIDTLGVTMLNLKNDLVKNVKNWDDNTLLVLYDTLQASNKAVSSLIGKVKFYIDKVKNQLG